MTKLFFIILLVFSLAVPTAALEIEAPEVPQSGREFMPENTDSFPDALWQLLQNAIHHIRPDLADASQVSITIIAAVMAISLLRTFSGKVKTAAELTGATAIAAILLSNTNSMIRMGSETVLELSNYGKMLYPVMATAIAAQGRMTTSTALYTGTAVFNAILGSLISGLLVPMVYVFLSLAVASSAVGEDILKKMRDIVKSTVSWCLKIVLTVFTTYMSITGVVSGTTDAAVLKATKVTISSVVPVVGSILSDASEAVLVSAGLMKNAAGIYGILAALAVFLEPFLRIGAHYLVLKATTAVCAVFGSKEMTGLIDDFSSAMGLLLAMTGSACLLLLISTVCFMKGVG